MKSSIYIAREQISKVTKLKENDQNYQNRQIDKIGQNWKTGKNWQKLTNSDKTGK